jgi:hypothetical protein
MCINVAVITFTCCISHDEAVDLGNRSVVTQGVTLDEQFESDFVIAALDDEFGQQSVEFGVHDGGRVIFVLKFGTASAGALKAALRPYGTFCCGARLNAFNADVKNARDAARNGHAAEVASQRAANKERALEKRQFDEAADAAKMQRVKSSAPASNDDLVSFAQTPKRKKPATSAEPTAKRSRYTRRVFEATMR